MKRVVHARSVPGSHLSRLTEATAAIPGVMLCGIVCPLAELHRRRAARDRQLKCYLDAVAAEGIVAKRRPA